MLNYPSQSGQPDTFICHASEDKESIARPLAQALGELGVNAWFDEFEIALGDSIRQKIDQGLANARSATVILSRPFFSKNWTQYEMDGIIEKHVRRETILIPIWHAITHEEVRDSSPSVADIHALNSSLLTIPQIAERIAERIRPTPTGKATQSNAEQSTPPPISPRGTNFGVFYIAPEGTAELPSDTEPKSDPMMLFSEPAGWISMVNNNEELEYINDGDTLRFRLNQSQGEMYISLDRTVGGHPFGVKR